MKQGFDANVRLYIGFQIFGQVIQWNLYKTALYIAVTLCTTVTEQLPKNHLLYLL